MTTRFLSMPRSAIAVVFILYAVASAADPECTAQPREKWMPESELHAKISAQGYKLRVLKLRGSCYEIAGYDKEGKASVAFFSPVDGHIVKGR